MLIFSVLNYNNWEATLRCLSQVPRACSEIEFRIVVGDHSPEAQVSKIKPGLSASVLARTQFVHRPDNPGFGAGHNRNFRKAEPEAGDSFLVLNNDIQFVDRDLLDAMLSANAPGTIVGPIIRTSSTKHVWFAGGKINPITGDVRPIKSEPRRDRMRTRFLCGCCMLIRAEDFVHLGGFDETFFMYAEDLDLSLRATDLGYECIVVNRTLMHDVGGYSRGQYTSLYLRENSKNRLVCMFRHKLGLPIVRQVHFAAKYVVGRCVQLAWGSERPAEQCLETLRGVVEGFKVRNGAPKRARFALGRQNSTRPSVLMVLPHPPNHLRPRSLSMLGDFLAFANVDLMYLDHGDESKIPSNIGRVTRVPNSFISRLFRVGIGCLMGKPTMYQYYHSRRLKKIFGASDLSQYDAIYVKKLPLHELKITHKNIILDIPDCATKQVTTYAKGGSGVRRLFAWTDSLFLADYERRACSSAAKVLCTVEREAQALRELGIRTPVMPLTHSTNARHFEPHVVRDREPRVLSFHGKLGYFANELALDALAKRILPRLCPNSYVVRIAGQAAPKLRRKYPALQFTGRVEDLTYYLSDTDLGVFPIEVAAGISNKALESLGSGIPVVVTAELAEGLPGSECLLEKGIYPRPVPEFAETINSYFALPLTIRQSISDGCIKYVEELHDASARRRKLYDYVFGETEFAETQPKEFETANFE